MAHVKRLRQFCPAMAGAVAAKTTWILLSRLRRRTTNPIARELPGGEEISLAPATSFHSAPALLLEIVQQ